MITEGLLLLAIAMAIYAVLTLALLGRHQDRIATLERREKRNARFIRSRRVGCSCWQDPLGRSVCDLCA